MSVPPLSRQEKPRQREGFFQPTLSEGSLHLWCPGWLDAKMKSQEADFPPGFSACVPQSLLTNQLRNVSRKAIKGLMHQIAVTAVANKNI